MMKAGADSGSFVTILIYVILFGGAVVAEIVKGIKKRRIQRELEERRARGQEPPPAEILEEETVEEDEEEEEEEPESEEEPQRGRPSIEIKKMFEEVFGPPPIRRDVREKQENVAQTEDETTKGTLVDIAGAGDKQMGVASAAQLTVAEHVPLERRIFKDREYSDMQKAIIYSEIFGMPRALSRWHRARRTGLGA